MPRLTIIMPAWNAASTIAAALRSTLVAMPTDAEIVVYDDASTDGTRRVVQEFADRTSRVSLVEGTLNIGAGRARNELIAQSDSEFVAAMDADDICLPHRFVGYRRSIKDVDIRFAPIIRFARRSRIHIPRAASLSASAMPLALLLLNPVPQSTMIARRAALEGGETYRSGYAQDYELWMRLTASGARSSMTSLATVAYRQHPNQATSQPDYEQQVQANMPLLESYNALAAAVLGIDARKTSTEELRARLERSINEVERFRDREHLRRLLRSRWSLPLRTPGRVPLQESEDQ